MFRIVGELAGWGGVGIVATILVVIALLAFVVLGGALVAIDATTHRLPDRLVLPLNAVVIPALVIAALVIQDWGGAARTLAGGAAAGGLFLMVHLLAPRALGFGDVKLVPALGALSAWLSWGHLLLAGVLGLFLAGLLATAVLIIKRDRKAHIAFGPPLILGTALALLW